ncbi:transposase [Mycolicibacterium duvalii]|nr:transposase [Mycolicibacterium duvalii]
MFIRPHCAWQNGKAERFNRNLQTEWAYRRIFTNSRPYPATARTAVRGGWTTRCGWGQPEVSHRAPFDQHRGVNFMYTQMNDSRPHGQRVVHLDHWFRC